VNGTCTSLDSAASAVSHCCCVFEPSNWRFLTCLRPNLEPDAINEQLAHVLIPVLEMPDMFFPEMSEVCR